MTENEILNLFDECGVFITNTHAVFNSGKHSGTYVNKDALYPHTSSTSRVCAELAERFKDDNIDIVIAPAIGGVILSTWTAHHLSEKNKREILSVYAEKDGDGFIIKRGFDKLIANKNVLVIEDIITTGNSAKKVIEAVRALNGNIIGLGVLCNRGALTAENFGVPKLVCLTTVNFPTYEASDCPLCQSNVPINTSIGHGAKWLAGRESATK